MERPTGVTIIAALGILGGTVLVILGILSLAVFGLPSEGLFAAFAIFFSTFYILLGLTEFIASWGLLVGKGWAWTLNLVLAALSIVLVLFFPGSSFWTIIINAIIIYYLFRPNVKAFFGKGPAGSYQPPPPPTTTTQKTATCPRCGQQLTYIEQYKRWYCYNCQQYSS
jgi:hypothetical protein